jgi:ketosteroid isomerase-like protein
VNPQAIVDELLAADRAFSAASARTDLVTGLSAMFAPEVTMPLPTGQFANGASAVSEFLRSNADNLKSKAEWTPIRGGISADGLHGFTFGFMTLTQSDGTIVPLKYMAYWVKGREGWRAVAYKRARRPAGAVSMALLAPALPPALTPASADPATIEKWRVSLEQAERTFSDTAQKIGLGAAFARFGSADAVNMGGPNSPNYIVGAEAIGQAIGASAPGTTSPVHWSAERVIVASSGDLGVTFGMIRPNGAATGGQPFFTIWRRASVGEPWRYVAE